MTPELQDAYLPRPQRLTRCGRLVDHNAPATETSARTDPGQNAQRLARTLSAQIRRKKERVSSRKARPARTRPGSPPGNISGPEPTDEAPPGSVVVRRTSAKPMSLEEAIDQLRLQIDGLLVFRNARTGAVNVLRRRPEGTVELVEPAG